MRKRNFNVLHFAEVGMATLIRVFRPRSGRQNLDGIRVKLYFTII